MISLKSKTVQEIMRYFLVNREAKTYVRDLSRILSEDASNLSKKLRVLEKEGLLMSESNFTKKYFLNKNYTFLPEIERLFWASYGVPVVLGEALKKVGGLSRAYIYGSYAKGGFGEGSDIDLMLVGSHSAIEAKKIIIPFQKSLGREFNIVDITEEELKKRIREKDPFYTSVMGGKLIKLN